MPAIMMAILMTTLLITGCRTVAEGSGNMETREFDFSDFTGVEIGGAFHFEIVRSDSFGISITTDDDMFEHIRVTERGGTLTIDLTSRASWITAFGFGSSTRRAVIRMPRLYSLNVSGASQGSASGFRSIEALDVDLSGASKVTFRDLAAGDTDIDV